MIKLLIENYDSRSDEEISIKNGETIKDEAKKGDIFLLWESKPNKEDARYLSFIEEVQEDGFTAEQFDITYENKNLHRQGDMLYIHMNVRHFDVYILNKEEIQPYLKRLIVAELQNR